MTIGETLLWLSLLSGLVGLVPGRGRAWFARLHAASLLAALALLVSAFLNADLGYAYVWNHTRPDYAWYYQLAGVWGGEEGTILLWASAVATWLVLVQRKRGEVHERAALVLLTFSTALSGILVAVHALAATNADKLLTAPFGRGLAEVLITPLMVIHPPIQFLGYALMSVPAAYAVGHWAAGSVGDRSWAGPAYKWARVAWLFATTGLGLGALWAYAVLSFGGYWSWDPVEVANILPWLALTAFLHAGKHFEKFGDHALAAPLLAAATALLALFATFATRSGLWVSVHAFTDPTGSFEPDAPARLLAILQIHAPTRVFTALLLAATLGALALFANHHKQRTVAAPLFALAGIAAFDVRFLLGAYFESARHIPFGVPLLGALILAGPVIAAFLAQDETRRKLAIDARTTMSAGVALFILALAVTFVLNAQVVNGPDRAVFDTRAPFVVLPIVSTITVMMALTTLGKRGALALAASGAIAGAVCWYAFPNARLVALASPFLFAALVAVVLRLNQSQGKSVIGAVVLAASTLVVVLVASPPNTILPDAWSVPVFFVGMLAATAGFLAGSRIYRGKLEGVRVREMGIYLIHLAVILGLLGFAASTYSQDREVLVAYPVGDDIIGAPQVSSSDGRIDAVRVPVVWDGTAASLDFEWRGSHYAPNLDIRRSPTRDVYISPLAFHVKDGAWVGATNAATQRAPVGEVDMVTFSASTLPLVGLLWSGLWLGVLGMGFVIGGAAGARRSSR